MASDKSKAVVDFFNAHHAGSVSSFVQSKGWKENPDMIERVIHGNTTMEDEEYLETKLGALSHKRDSRSAVEYGSELIRGWIIEDLIAEQLESAGVPISLSGEDKEREFLEQTTADADLVAKVGGQTTHIEVVTDYSGFWKRTGNADLRDNKYNQIKGHPNPLVLGIDFDSDTVFVANPEEVDVEYMSSHPYWNKPAYRIDVSELDFVPLHKVGTKVRESL